MYSRAMIVGSITLAAAMIALTPVWGTTGTALGAVGGELVTVALMLRGAAGEVRLFTRGGFVRMADIVYLKERFL